MLPRIKITFERWRFNKEFRLWVSNKGKVLDEYRQEPRVRMNQKGYLRVWSECMQKYISIHRLVLVTWRPLKDMENLTVDHRDHNKRNNAVNNLIWMPREENWACEAEDREIKKPVVVAKTIRANGIAMTVEDAATFIYALPGTCGQYNKVQIIEKLKETLNSNKEKKTVFGVTLEEIKS